MDSTSILVMELLSFLFFVVTNLKVVRAIRNCSGRLYKGLLVVPLVSFLHFSFATGINFFTYWHMPLHSYVWGALAFMIIFTASVWLLVVRRWQVVIRQISLKEEISEKMGDGW